MSEAQWCGVQGSHEDAEHVGRDVNIFEKWLKKLSWEDKLGFLKKCAYIM